MGYVVLYTQHLQIYCFFFLFIFYFLSVLLYLYVCSYIWYLDPGKGARSLASIMPAGESTARHTKNSSESDKEKEWKPISFHAK